MCTEVLAESAVYRGREGRNEDVSASMEAEMVITGLRCLGSTGDGWSVVTRDRGGKGHADRVNRAQEPVGVSP